MKSKDVSLLQLLDFRVGSLPVLCAFLQLADIISTLIAKSMGAVEANPFIINMGNFWISYKILVTASFCILYELDNDRGKIILWLLVWSTSVVVACNVLSIVSYLVW